MFKLLDSISSFAHWAPRVALASVFIYHGTTKFPVAQGMAEMMGMPIAMIYLLATMEVGGALLVLLGGFGAAWATRLGAVIISPVMLGAIFMVHWPRWSFVATDSHPMGGMEFQVTLLLILLYLFVRGNSVNEAVIYSLSKQNNR